MEAVQTAVADPHSLRRLSRRLLGWFARHRRDLPWRATRDPYAIWVSEVMLQQTQVTTVVPYYHRFLAAFPTLESLADAEETHVLRLWEGLGYYRRARQLHAAAGVIVREHGSKFPSDPDVARSLPGLGRYSVGAILSQAFDARLPIVEVNSRRVLCRFFGFRGDPRRGPGERWLWEMAAQSLPARRVGDFNQALMELGALVCLPKAPRCAGCPLAQECRGRQQGLQETIPMSVPAARAVHVEEVAVVVYRRPYIFLVQRPHSAARWAGLWEFPHGATNGGAPREIAPALVQEWTGLRVRLEDSQRMISHTVTRHRIRMNCFTARYLSGRFRSAFYQEGRWVRPGELHLFPFSAPQRRLAESILH